MTAKKSKKKAKQGRIGKVLGQEETVKIMSKIDKRSKKAKSIDRDQEAAITLPATKKNIEKWKKDPARVDIIGWDSFIDLVEVSRIIHELDGKKQALRKKQSDRMKAKHKGKKFNKIPNTKLTGLQQNALIGYIKKHGVDPQTIDIQSIYDSSLTANENIEIIKEAANRIGSVSADDYDSQYQDFINGAYDVEND